MDACSMDAFRDATMTADPPARRGRSIGFRVAVGSLLLALLLPGPACSIKKLAVNKLGDAMAEGGATFASDEDPELIEAAVPFSLKLMESLLAESPRHRELLTAVASGFTQYAYAFVQLEGDRLEETDLDAATASWERAKKLYLRARDYAVRGLDARREGTGDALRVDPASALEGTGPKDVPLLYWTAASWAGAIALSKDDPDLVGDLPIIEALIGRALELDESYREGAIHEFLIVYEMTRPGGECDPAARAREHFARAMELTGGQLASPLVALAESVAVAEQDRVEFEELLRRALAIDPDLRPEWRLANLVFQRRARWLLERTDRLILD
jgi:predicted anti-sigma-YlaC factor YlaD